MFTMAKIYDGASYLSSHLSANDYYAEGESVVGVWCGKGAKLLELQGRTVLAKDAAFERLRLNRHPQTGRRLTERTSTNRIALFDFQVSAPKSVSLLAVTFDDRRLRDAHQSAAHDAFSFLERFSARRLRKGAAAWSDATRFTGNLCAASFLHDASRELDAQIHTHFVVTNATHDQTEQRWAALTESEILRAIRCCGKVYQSTLAKSVIRAGYTIEIIRDARGQVTGFEISGVTAADRATASRRRAAIDAAIRNFEATRRRAPTKKEVDKIVRETRAEKLVEITTEEVRRRQLASFTPERRSALQNLVKQSKNSRPVAFEVPSGSALSAVRDHVFEREPTTSVHAFIAEVLNQNLGAVDPIAVINAVLKEKPDLCMLSSASIPETAIICSYEGLRAELFAIRIVNEGLGNCSPLGSPTFKMPAFLSGSQQRCVAGILESCDTVTALRGVAGAGKTTVLSVIESDLRARETKSFYCAPNASAVEVLRNEGFTHAMTLASFLLGTRDEDLRGAVIIVDEAGLISSRQGATLFDFAKRAGARIVLVGDSRQHSAVDAGDFLAMLETHSPLRSHELTDIRRQTEATYRSAIQVLARGHARAGLLALDSIGFVHESGEDYIVRAAENYLSHNLHDVILVSPTWSEIDALTEEIRVRRREKGELICEQIRYTFRSLKWTAAQKRKASNYQSGNILSLHTQITASGINTGTSLEVVTVSLEKIHVRDSNGVIHHLDPVRSSTSWDVAEKRSLKFAVGDLVLIQQNLKSARLVNGEVLRIKAIDTNGTITASDKAGEIRIIPSTFGAFTYGYAITSHKSQGRTANHVVVCAARLDAKSTYVAFSRGRKSAACFTTEKEALISGLPLRASSRPAAVDYLGGKQFASSAKAQRRTRARTWLHLLAIAARRAAHAARRMLRRIPRL
jgi:conjugative relaxase-like TrwC/TraI family protein